MENKDRAIMFLKKILTEGNLARDYIHALAYINLARIYFSSGFYVKSAKYATKGLHLIEPEVF